jgi:hypothetical protein
MYVPWIAQVNSWIGLSFGMWDLLAACNIGRPAANSLYILAILMYLIIYKIGPYGSGAKDNFPLLS